MQVDEGLVAFLLPYLLAGVGAAASPDYRAASYMAAAQLASRTGLSADLASGECRTGRA